MLDTRTFKKFVCCIAVLLTATTVVAQQDTTSRRREPGDLDAIRKVSTLVGTDVMNSPNSKIAVVRDLVLSPDGTVLYAVLGWGGLAGVAETYTAAPFDALGVRNDDGKWAVNLDMTAEDLKKAPAMQSENCRELMDTQWVARIDQFFRPHAGAQENAQTSDHPVRRERQAVQRVLLATKIRSAKVKNGQNVDMGTVEELLLDRNYRAVFAIVGQGGVLGIGENFIPVPWSKLAFTVNREGNGISAMIDATKDQLEKAPLVKGSNYATLLAPGFAEAVRRYFGVKQQNTER